MKLTIKDFIPFFIVLAFDVVIFPIYMLTFDPIDIQRILQCIGALAVPFVIPVLSLLCKKRISMILNLVISLFAVSTILFGGVLNFYGKIEYYDKAVHCLFGVVGALIMVVLLMYSKAWNINKVTKFIIIMLGVLGMAAIWEIYEYSYTVTFGADLQAWLPDLEQYGDLTVKEFFEFYRPMWDTIWDIIVAAIGVGIFYVILAIDYLTGSKFLDFVKKETE